MGWGVGDLTDPNVAVALGHRVAALAVGLLLAGTLLLAWRRGNRRVGASLALATALYPLQVAVGALVATGAVAVPSAVHLALGVVIFGLALLALLWHLEAVADAAEDDPTAAGTAAVVRAPTPTATDVDDASDPERATAADDAPGVPDADATRSGPLRAGRARAAAYLRLTKPRLMWLLCLVAVAAMVLAAGRGLAPSTALATVAGGVLAVGASGVFNNVLERDVDRKMDRTADRPIVQGEVPARRAVAFGVLLAVLSVAVFVAAVNVLAAALALLAILFYSVVYTLILKPHTRQNIVLGGAVGAFPALIGWAAVENRVGLPALVLGGVIFLWTPAHFYNLALAYRDDYAAAGFPMLPVVAGAATTRRHVLLYLGATLVGSVALGAATRLDWLYALTVVLVGSAFLWTVLRLFRERTERAAFRTFHASNAYLGCLLLATVVDALVV